MKNFSRKIVLITLLFLSFNGGLFSEEQPEVSSVETEEKKSTFELGKDVAQLKFELFKIENKLGEYKEISDFDLSLVKAKKEHLLRKWNAELLESVNNNKEAAEKILEEAATDIISKAKELKDKGKDFLEYIKDYFE